MRESVTFGGTGNVIVPSSLSSYNPAYTFLSYSNLHLQTPAHGSEGKPEIPSSYFPADAGLVPYHPYP